MKALPLVLAFGLVALLTGQERVRLGHGKTGNSPLERACAALLLPDQRVAAMHELWRAGPAAVPLLLREVERSSEAAGPALQVLAALGGDARSAVPVLQRLHAVGGHRQHTGIGIALAEIGERDTVLVACWSGNFVAELDLEGKQLRRVDHPGVWGVRPLAGDRLLVASVSNSVAEIDWTGKVHWSASVAGSPLDARRLPDGSTLVACWHGPCVVKLDAAGKELWRLPGIHAVDVEPLWNGNVLVCGYEDKRLVEATPDGAIVWKLEFAQTPMDVDVLPSGNLLVAFDDARAVVEYTRDGGEVARLVPPADPEDCNRLPDGRTLLADAQGCVLLDAAGKEVWRFQAGQSGHVIARIAGDAARR